MSTNPQETQALDARRQEEFEERMVAALNGGALALMAFVGHRTGLLDAMRDGPPETSAALAQRAGLQERYVRRSLAPDGIYLAQDIKGSSHHHGDRDHPLGPLLYALSCMHCMTVSLAGGGEGLGAMWGREQAEQYFREAGFESIEVHELDHDPQNYYYICRP